MSNNKNNNNYNNINNNKNQINETLVFGNNKPSDNDTLDFGQLINNIQPNNDNKQPCNILDLDLSLNLDESIKCQPSDFFAESNGNGNNQINQKSHNNDNNIFMKTGKIYSSDHHPPIKQNFDFPSQAKAES